MSTLPGSASPQLEPHFHGEQHALRRLPGAVATRVVHPRRQDIPAHRHDWPVLSIYRTGEYVEEAEAGAVHLDGPSVILHPAGGGHADQITDRGLETVVIGFDLAWLGPVPGLDIGRSYYWTGGAAAVAAEQLLACWRSGGSDEALLREATRRLIALGLATSPPPSPAWLPQAQSALAEGLQDTRALARRLDLHPAWLARAYRAARGEGLQQAARRLRVERAAAMLRRGADSLAMVAAEAGFSDQSHMNRAFLAVLGRTPGQVSRESAAPLAG